MAFSGNYMTTTFKKEILEGVHNFATGGNTFKIAMYTNSAAFTATTTAYTASNEVPNSGGYTAGGGTLTNQGVFASGTTAYTDFADISFASTTITARGAMIYNDTASGDPAVAILDFGSDKTSTSGTFTIQFPSPAAATAIIRIA